MNKEIALLAFATVQSMSYASLMGEIMKQDAGSLLSLPSQFLGKQDKYQLLNYYSMLLVLACFVISFFIIKWYQVFLLYIASLFILVLYEKFAGQMKWIGFYIAPVLTPIMLLILAGSAGIK